LNGSLFVFFIHATVILWRDGATPGRSGLSLSVQIYEHCETFDTNGETEKRRYGYLAPMPLQVSRTDA